MSQYPTDRTDCGYAIRYIKTLLDSDAIRNHGYEAVLLAIFIASREDKLHYTKSPQFWRAELMDRFGHGSPKGFIRIRTAAVEAGLLHYLEGTRIKPGKYWTLVPDWMRPKFEAFRKRNGSNAKRSDSGTRNGTANGTANGTLSITHNPTPKKKSPSAFVPPSVEDVQAYCQERKSNIDPQRFVDYYEANGWVQGKGKPIKSWKAAVRTWEGNNFSGGRSSEAPQQHETFDPSDAI